MRVIDENEKENKKRCVKLSKGDSVSVLHTDKSYSIGDQYDGFKNLIVTKILYKPKKWWQFWKRKHIIGYEVTCMKG